MLSMKSAFEVNRKVLDLRRVPGSYVIPEHVEMEFDRWSGVSSFGSGDIPELSELVEHRKLSIADLFSWAIGDRDASKVVFTDGSRWHPISSAGFTRVACPDWEIDGTEAMGSYIPIPCSFDGTVDIQALGRICRENDVEVVSIPHAVPLTGVLNPVNDIAAVVGKTPLHLDVTHSFNAVSLASMKADFISMTGEGILAVPGCGVSFGLGKDCDVPLPELSAFLSAMVVAWGDRSACGSRIGNASSILENLVVGCYPGTEIVGSGIKSRVPGHLCVILPEGSSFNPKNLENLDVLVENPLLPDGMGILASMGLSGIDPARVVAMRLPISLSQSDTVRLVSLLGTYMVGR